MPLGMPLTRDEIDDIATECFATDVQYVYERLKDWDEDAVRDFFEAGGDTAPDEEPFMSAIRQANGNLLQRLEELQPDTTGGSTYGAAAAPMDFTELEDLLAVWTGLAAGLRGTPCRSFLLGALMRSLVAAVAPSDNGAMAAHFKALSAVALSSSPEVSVDLGSIWSGALIVPRAPVEAPKETDARMQPMGGAVGVLMLGFGGSSLASLRAFETVYEKRWPTWIRILHAGPLLLTETASPGEAASPEAARAAELPETRAALDQCLAAVAPCESLIVHIQSNQGHMIWCHLLDRALPFIKRRLVRPAPVTLAAPCPHYPLLCDGGQQPKLLAACPQAVFERADQTVTMAVPLLTAAPLPVYANPMCVRGRPSRVRTRCV